MEICSSERSRKVGIQGESLLELYSDSMQMIDVHYFRTHLPIDLETGVVIVGKLESTSIKCPMGFYFKCTVQ